MDPPPTPQPQLSFESTHIRRSIIGSYWLLILLAVPLWWHTTTIERLALPSARVHAQAEQALHFPISVALDAPAEGLRGLLHQRAQRDPAGWTGLDVEVRAMHDGDKHNASSPSSPGTYAVHTHHPTSAESLLQGRELFFSSKSPDSLLPELADTLSALLAPPPHAHTAPYAPRYRLAFSLLNEDATSGHAVVGWDVQRAIARHVSPLLASLEVLHNFTIESQVQFHAPLAFTPRALDGAYGLTPEDLTVFVNSAEWTLSSSVSSDPVLHFILFVPSASRRPLYITDTKGTPSPSSTFLLPQWGGIFIFNPPEAPETINTVLSGPALDVPFAAFASHLRALLGVPRLPPGLRTSPDSQALSPTQLDALLRLRALENARGARDTLRSIVQLVAQIPNMPVGQDVRGDVLGALSALEKLYAAPAALAEALTHSAQALSLASRAFFSPGMLALLYFPAEHKAAVYMPLFASALVPLAAAALREVLAWRRGKRAAAAEVEGRPKQD